MNGFLQYTGDLAIILGLALIVIFFLLISWLFEFFKKKKTAEFFEKIADKIKDFFT